MPDQLEDLKRQRALVAEHLAWLDRQIAAEAARTRPATVQSSGSPPIAAPSIPTTPPPLPGATGSEEVDALFARFASEEQPALRPPSKLGCWLGFSILLLGAISGIVALIYRAYG